MRETRGEPVASLKSHDLRSAEGTVQNLPSLTLVQVPLPAHHNTMTMLRKVQIFMPWCQLFAKNNHFLRSPHAPVRPSQLWIFGAHVTSHHHSPRPPAQLRPEPRPGSAAFCVAPEARVWGASSKLVFLTAYSSELPPGSRGRRSALGSPTASAAGQPVLRADRIWIWGPESPVLYAQVGLRKDGNQGVGRLGVRG